MDNNDLEHLKAQYEQPITVKKSKKWRVIILSALVLLVFAGIAVGTLAIFKNKLGDSGTAPTVQTIPGPEPTAIIDKIAASQTILDSKNYTLFRKDSVQPGTSPDTTTIVFKQAGYSYVTNVTPDDGLRFTLTDAKLASNKEVITNTIKQVLKDASFTETTQDTSALNSYSMISYVNGGTVCQLINFANGKLTGLEQSILCVSSKSLQASYATVSSLLQKAGSDIASSAKAVGQSSVISGTKKLVALTVQTTDSKDSNNYYFATLDTDYEYLGKRATPSVDNQASYTLSTELKTNISDAKWGTFLTDNIK